MEMTTPDYMHISAFPLAYTKSTKGVVEGKVVFVEDADRLEKQKGKLK
jgi:hypothetical protein